MKRLIVTTTLAFFAASALATVNVNTAQQSELQRVKGLDKHMAKAIIEYRAQKGALASLDDLEKVPGVGRDVVARLGPEIAFNGDAYVPTKAAPVKEKPKR
ncbi:MAG: helix-hairpin-helix domain-containing protein [Usitatibacter sp.]